MMRLRCDSFGVVLPWSVMVLGLAVACGPDPDPIAGGSSESSSSETATMPTTNPNPGSAGNTTPGTASMTQGQADSTSSQTTDPSTTNPVVTDTGASSGVTTNETATGTAATGSGTVTTSDPATTSDSATTAVTTGNTTTPGSTTNTSDGMTSTGVPNGCGDGNIDPGEQCDGDNLQGFTCASLGLDEGTLACAATCTFDISMCGSSSGTTTTGGVTTTGTPGGCGDGTIDPGEQCDGLDLQGFDCAALGLGGGTLLCDPVTCTFDTSMCMSTTGGTSS